MTATAGTAHCYPSSVTDAISGSSPQVRARSRAVDSKTTSRSSDVCRRLRVPHLADSSVRGNEIVDLATIRTHTTARGRTARSSVRRNDPIELRRCGAASGSCGVGHELVAAGFVADSSPVP